MMINNRGGKSRQKLRSKTDKLHRIRIIIETKVFAVAESRRQANDMPTSDQMIRSIDLVWYGTHRKQ